MESEWRFVFVDESGSKEQISSGALSTLGSGADETPTTTPKNETLTMGEEMLNKGSQKLLQQTIISPLNSVTSGLASPIYKLAKTAMTTGITTAGLATAGVAIAMQLISTGIGHIQNRLAKLETEARELGNNDNVLLRAGSVSQASYYTYNLFGVSKKTNRS